MDAPLATLAVTRTRHCVLGALLSGIAMFAAGAGSTLMAPIGSALAQEQKSAGNTVRPEIGKPIQAALDLLKQKRGKEALARVHEADAVPNKTPYEAYLVERVHAQAEAAAGDAAAAARAFEATAASSAISAAERLQFLAAAAAQYYQAKNYGKAAEIGARYFKDGGTDKSIRTLYVQALYLGNNFARSASEMLLDVQAEEAAGRAPTEAQLQVLADSYQKQKDQKGYANALEKLLGYYPKRDYWLNAIYGVAGRPGVSDRLSLDLARLKLATGTMQTTDEYMEAAQLSLQAGYPAEAMKFIDQGYAAGRLGSGTEAERHKRLRDLAVKSLAGDKKTLGQDDAQVAASKDGAAQLNAGFNYVLHGSPDKGLEMMEQGMRKSGLKRPDDARLHLGYAYHVAGQNQKAIQVLKSVRGSDGSADLAHLWIVHLGRGS
jgi:hypothetical protein